MSPADFQTDCGRRLRQLIDLMGMEYTEAAALMAVSKHVLRNWMAGENPVQPYGLYRLAKLKGVDFNYVYSGDWSRLPAELGRAVEAEVLARLADATGQDHQERETAAAKR